MSGMTLAVLGDGAWGTAIGLQISRGGVNRVRLWSAHAESAAVLRERRENVRLLPGVPIPENIELTANESEAIADADFWITAIPTVYLRSTLERFQGLCRPHIPVISLTKGIELETFQRPTEVIAEVLGTQSTAALSGPSHAEEVSRGLPASLVAASADPELARLVQGLFMNERLRIYTSGDLIGVELAGALKNVIGIAAGISDGLGFGDNAKSALMTRGLVEMSRFGIAFGADYETFHGLAGMGDLVTTCISPHGRNRRLGERLGRGETLDTIVRSTPMIAEGVTTAKSVHDRSSQLGIDMPIMKAVYRVLYGAQTPLAAVEELMMRRPRPEGRS